MYVNKRTSGSRPATPGVPGGPGSSDAAANAGEPGSALARQIIPSEEALRIHGNRHDDAGPRAGALRVAPGSGKSSTDPASGGGSSFTEVAYSTAVQEDW